MEALLVLLALYLIGVLLLLPIWTIIKFSSQREDQERLQRQLLALEREIQSLRTQLTGSAGTSATCCPH